MPQSTCERSRAKVCMYVVVYSKHHHHSAVVVWDREDYIKEAENQLGDTNIYDEVPNDAKPLMNIILWKIFAKEGIFVLIL